MSNSPLVVYTKLSPNHSGKRTMPIDRITPHCVVGQLSAESICGCFTDPARQASCNYGIGYDGKVSLCVDEGNRSWCSSSNANDQRAVTIECASDKTEPYAFKDVVYNRLIDLCEDICRRNGKKKLLWFGDKDKTLNYSPKSDEMVLTVHRWFANKSCPGNWMYARMGDLADKVTARLGGSAENTAAYTKIAGKAVATADQMKAYIQGVNPSVAKSVLDMIPFYLSEGETEGIRGDIAFAQSCLETGNFAFAGSAVTLDQNNFCGMGVTSNGMKGNSFDTPQMGIRAQIQHLKAYASTDALKNAVIDPRFQYVTRGCAEYVEWLGQQENPQGKGWAAGAGYGTKILTILKKIVGSTASKPTNSAFPAVPFTVKVIIDDLNYRSAPSMSGTVKGQTGKGVFTIVEVSDGWGKLKSGAGWIYLENPSYCTIQGTVNSTPAAPTLKVGDKVKMAKNAPVYGKSSKFASWVYDSTLYVREISGNRIVVSTLKTGDVTGAVDKKYLTKV